MYLAAGIVLSNRKFGQIIASSDLMAEGVHKILTVSHRQLCSAKLPVGMYQESKTMKRSRRHHGVDVMVIFHV